MIDIEVKLSGDLSADLDRFAQSIQEKVLFAGVAAMANVIYEEVKLNVSGDRAGMPKVLTGNLRDSIYRVFSPERSSLYKKTYRISWNARKAPHGHLIEFGTSRAPAYPFVRPAFARVNDAIAAGQARMAEKFEEVTK
jgi:HK97 gp10 family phage protein